MDRKLSREMNLNKWAQDMKDWKESGLKQSEWCALNGIVIHTFKWRCREVKRELKLSAHMRQSQQIEENPASLAVVNHKSPTFAEIILEKDALDMDTHTANIVVEMPRAKVSIAEFAKPEHIRTVLEVLSHA